MAKWHQLLNDPSKWEPIFIKEYITKAIRLFFEQRDYHELESPILAPCLPQERYLDVLHTDIVAKDGSSKRAYLIPSTERYNKMSLCAGLGNHFVISKVFRGLEEYGPDHSPEFTMMEWYELDHDYHDLMSTVEELLPFIKRYLNKRQGENSSLDFAYDDYRIDLTPPYDRISIPKALQEYAGIELSAIQDIKAFRNIARDKHYLNAHNYDWQTIFELIFANEIEPKLNKAKPVFVYDYPKQLCPLTKINTENPLVSEKVELYLGQKEIANGYTEQTDPIEQEKRFREEQAARKKLGKPEVAFDAEMLEAMKLGMPPVAGMGLGIDRLAMIISNSKALSEIVFS